MQGAFGRPEGAATRRERFWKTFGFTRVTIQSEQYCRLTLLGLVVGAADARKPSIGIEYLIDGSTVSQWRQRGSRPTIGCAHVVADRNVCQIVAAWAVRATWRSVQRLLLYV